MRAGLLRIALVALATAALLWALAATTPEPVLRGRFLVVPWGWLRLLAAFAVAAGGVGLATYLFGRATRPGRAARHAVAAATHLFLWGVIAAVFYPVVYLLAVSLNRKDTLAGALPRAGHLLVRSGVFPDPADLSLVQYRTILGDTHVLPQQVVLAALVALVLVALVGVRLWRRGGAPDHRAERASRWLGWALFGLLAALLLSVRPAQFYGLTPAGERVPTTTERTMLLFIRNTLLVSGATGLLAVVLATTAGYGFARLRFEGRHTTLLTFVFVQMFPGFMAVVAIYFLMSALGLLNFAGLILAYSGGAIAFAAWIFKGYLESIPPSLEEAAMVDGATRWGAFWRIILPLSVPMLLFIFLLQFIGTYSEFILANILLGGDDDQWTVGMALRSFTTGRFDTQWGALAASAVLGSLPIVVIFYAFQEALTGQYQAGGVKG